MIELPKRSVTRFFIPLIDVLILLVGIFLIMPYVATDPGKAEAGTAPEPPPAYETTAEAELNRLARQLADAKAELQRQTEAVLGRLAIKVLEIDGATGKLFDPAPERFEVATAADAEAVIDRFRRDAGGREIYFLLMFPRQRTGFPEEQQLRQYQRWFAGVPHGFDNPGGRLR